MPVKFDYDYYTKKYPGLSKHGINNRRKAYNHYIKTGKQKGYFGSKHEEIEWEKIQVKSAIAIPNKRIKLIVAIFVSSDDAVKKCVESVMSTVSNNTDLIFILNRNVDFPILIDYTMISLDMCDIGLQYHDEVNVILRLSTFLDYDLGIMINDDVFFTIEGWDQNVIVDPDFTDFFDGSMFWYFDKHLIDTFGYLNEGNRIDSHSKRINRHNTGSVIQYIPYKSKSTVRVHIRHMFRYKQYTIFISNNVYNDFIIEYEHVIRSGMNDFNIIKYETVNFHNIAGELKVTSLQRRNRPGIITHVDLMPNKTYLFEADVKPLKDDKSSLKYVSLWIRSNDIYLTPQNIYFNEATTKQSVHFTTPNTVSVTPRTTPIDIGIVMKQPFDVDYSFVVRDMKLTQLNTVREYVDAVIVINLDRESDNYKLAKYHLNNVSIDCQKFRAIDSVEDDKWRSGWDNYMSGPLTDEDRCLNRRAIDKPGAWGYLLSMINIFDDAIRKNYESVIICDDDILPIDDFVDRFSDGILQISDDWKLVYFGASQHEWKTIKIHENIEYYRPNDDTCGSFMNMYKRNVFKTIVDQARMMSSPFDSKPLKNIKSQYPSDCYTFYPNLSISRIDKDGIHESRDVVKYSSKFRWDNDLYRSSHDYYDVDVTINNVNIDPKIGQKKLVIGITTYNRLSYLRSIIKTWVETKNNKYHWTLIVADNCSTDGTEEFLADFSPIGFNYVVLRNPIRGVARQTNSIIEMCTRLEFGFDLLFRVDDDIYFDMPGWDDMYLDASGMYQHLVYYNSKWKSEQFIKNNKTNLNLVSYCDALNSLGCFWTLTKNIIEKVGYFDEDEFLVRGHAHIDYTVRCCRAGFNQEDKLWDVKNSSKSIKLRQRDIYLRGEDHSDWYGIINKVDNEERYRRENLINNREDIFVKSKLVVNMLD